MKPVKIFFTRGVGRAPGHYLASFEMALRDAGIAALNLSPVHSIWPARVSEVSREVGVKRFQPGEVVFCVMAQEHTDEPNRLIAASIGVAIPKDRQNQHGYLSEHHGFGENAKEAGDRAEDLAAQFLGSTLGIEVNPEKDWDEAADEFRKSDLILKTRSVTQTAEGRKDLWTTVIAAAVFILPSQDSEDNGPGESASAA